MPSEQAKGAFLRLRWPVGLTFVAAALLAAGVAGVFEVAARSESLAGRLPPETIGSGQPQLDKKLVLLRKMVRRQGGLDCLFVGSSQVYRAVDPATVEPVFRQAAGRGLRSFNFGLGGMSENAEAPLAQIVVDKYRPKLIVIGTSSYGLDDRRDIKFQKFLEGSSWYQYNAGDFNVNGWLLDHSVAFRRYQGHRFWSEPTQMQGLLERSVLGMAPDGFGPQEPKAFRPVDEEGQQQLRTYRIAQSHLDSLGDLLRLRSPDLHIVVVELPIHTSVIELYGNGAADHARALDEIEKVVRAGGAPFWRYPAERAIPHEGWADFVHMNRLGAAMYSRWLGERLGEAVRDGRLPLPAR